MAGTASLRATRGWSAGELRRSESASGSVLYGSILFVALGIGLPAYVVKGFAVTDSNRLIATALVVYAALRLSVIFGSGRPRIVDAAFWTFTYSFLCLPWLAQISKSTYPLATGYSYDENSIAATDLVLAVGIVAYEVGRLVWLRRAERPMEAERPIETEGQGPVAYGVAGRRAAALAYIGLLFVTYSVLQHGLTPFFTSRDALTQSFLGPAANGGAKYYLNSDKATGGLLQVLTQAPIFIGTYYLLHLRRAARRTPGIWKPSAWLLAPLIIGNLIANNPISNAREWYGTVLIGFVSLYLPMREKRWAMRLFVFVLVFVSLFTFHQLAAYRVTGTPDFSLTPISSNLVSDPDYSSPQQAMNGVLYADAYGLQDGRQLLGAAFVWVPRSLWTTKPGSTGMLIGQAAGFAVSDPLWTEGQVDFGIAGTIAYLFLFGALATRLDSAYARRRSRNLWTSALAPLAASISIFLLRGSLVAAFTSLLPVGACVLMCSTLPSSRRLGVLGLGERRGAR